MKPIRRQCGDYEQVVELQVDWIVYAVEGTLRWR